jgi:hypothetical protein
VLGSVRGRMQQWRGSSASLSRPLARDGCSILLKHSISAPRLFLAPPGCGPGPAACIEAFQLFFHCGWRCRWAFYLQELGRGHWVSVAKAPLEAVVDAWGVSWLPWRPLAGTS